jgi:predicted transcriptional regulator
LYIHIITEEATMSEQLLIRIDPELKERLERLSRAEGKTTSHMVRELIRDYVKKRDIAGYIDGLWERTGGKLRARGAKPSDIGRAIKDVRKASR